MKISEETSYVKYVNAFYFSTVTMVTVGYGDILPNNPYEMIISILTIMFSCGVYGYCLNTIGVIFQELQKPQQELMSKL